MLEITTEKKLVWDNEANQMVVKTEVYCYLLGNKGTRFVEEGPMYCSTALEILQAADILKERLVLNLLKAQK
jgi:hypothetical protein